MPANTASFSLAKKNSIGPVKINSSGAPRMPSATRANGASRKS